MTATENGDPRKDAGTEMRYRTLGPTGLRVSELALGTMTFGEEWGWGAPEDTCRKMFQSYVDAGGNFIDTADAYTGGTSEEIVGDLIERDRDRFVVATKVALSTRPGDPNAWGSHRKHLAAGVKASLDRLGTDHLDLLWVHAWDPLTPLEETVRALDDLVARGLVHHVGFSDAPAWVVARANALAEARGWTPFCAIQAQYSLVERTPERALLPMAEHLGLGVTVWSPLGAGVLTGKYSDDGEGGDESGDDGEGDDGSGKDGSGDDGQGRGRLDVIGQEPDERGLSIANAVREVAEAVDATPAQVALAWIRHQDPTIVPIVGARTPAQLEENLASLDVDLADDQLDRLDAASRVDLGFPLGFLAEPYAAEMLHGGTRDRIDAPASRWVPHA